MRKAPDSPALAQARRLLYGAALGGVLLVGFVATARALRHELPGSRYLAWGTALGLVLGLLWLRPRRDLYAAGLFCLAVAGLGLWLGGAVPLRDGGILRYALGLVGAALLPVGWVLLATSAGSWRLGVTSYLLAGLAFVAIVYGADRVLYPELAGGWRPPSPRVLATLWLLWPAYVLQALGVSAWLPPGGD